MSDERTGRLPGCPFDQWVFDSAGHWLPEDIALLETTLHARMQEHYDHFQEYGGGFWRLRVNYPRTRFTALPAGGLPLAAASARALAAAITADYMALRQSWHESHESPKDGQHDEMV